MDYISLITPMGVVGGMGLIFGLGLGLASKVFAVYVDPLVPVIRDALPGANCGACGYAGCDAYAKAIVEDKASISLCPVGGATTLEKLAEITGEEAQTGERQVAFVKCNGNCENAKNKYKYLGVKDCHSAAYLQGAGPKSCEYGCLGLSSCVKECKFDALHIINGIAVVDEKKCVACEKCVVACPKNLIEMVPASKKVRVLCNSKNRGKAVMNACSVGCIACRKCVKACKFEAINVNDNLALVDYDKCVQCNLCAKACPTKAISERIRKKRVKKVEQETA